MINNDKRLDEIGNILFQEGAFFSSMTETEKDLFGEAVFLMAKKVVDEKHSNDMNNGEGIIKEAISNFARGFNISVNVNPNNPPVMSGCGCNCNCGNCNCCNDQYGGYQGPQGSYYKDDMINDGSYQPGPDEEMMYGDDSQVYPSMDMNDPMFDNQEGGDIDDEYIDPNMPK